MTGEIFSEEYLDFIKQSGLSGLTGGQHLFAEWLLLNQDKLKGLGDLETIFKEVRKYVKNK